MNKGILLLLGFVLVFGFVYGQPPLFHEFYGSLRCENGYLANDGTMIDVKLNDVDYKSVSVSGGNYHVIVQGVSGDNIKFYYGTELLSSQAFSPFGSTQLDLVTDGDGLIDLNDPGCSSSSDDDEGDDNADNMTDGNNTGCSDECSDNSIECLTNTSYRRCGNYDNDGCLEWSNELNCGSGRICTENGCVDQEFPVVYPIGMSKWIFIAIGVLVVIMGIWIYIIIRNRRKNKIYWETK
jgi:hypothetical protein